MTNLSTKIEQATADVVERLAEAIYTDKFGKCDPRERGPDAMNWARRKALQTLKARNPT